MITLKDSPILKNFMVSLQKEDSLLVEETWNSSKAFLVALAAQVTQKHVLFLTGTGLDEMRIFNDFAYFTKQPVIEFPAWETLPEEDMAPSPDVVGDRYQALSKITSKTGPYIILSNVQACLQKLIPPSLFNHLYLKLSIGDSHSFEGLIETLEQMGYRRTPVVSDKGEFAVRGGIIDLFPVSSPDPYRLEFFSNDIESIRIFDPARQTTVSKCTSLEITAASELELLNHQEKLSTLIDYLGKDTLIIFDDLLSFEDKAISLMSLLGKPKRTFATIDDFFSQIAPLQKLFFSTLSIDKVSSIQEIGDLTAFEFCNREFSAKRWRSPFAPLQNYLDLEELEEESLFAALKESNSSHLHFLGETELEKKAWEEKIQRAQLTSSYVNELGYLSSGFAILDSQELFIPMTELSHRAKIRRQKQRSSYHTDPVEILRLEPGEAIVHTNSGIGRFIGIEKRPNHLGEMTEFFLIEYAEGAKLFVPIHQANLISKYIGSNDVPPKLHHLGQTKWKKVKEQTQKEIVGYASELLQLYAEREWKEGSVCSPDSSDMLLFEENFPYIETEDQIKAIEDIKADLQSRKPMDRLICGDVGYGKTEVAMRAAFKAVVDGGKQVAVLVPTTVLTIQHFENFKERMGLFPINIDHISRFKSTKEVKETLKKAQDGKVDILIGTHRLLSEDVSFKNLGLIIVDEEQRFGVKAKEALKKRKAEVDCLTLSATPIPRTLYLSLMGARDLSVISTPPQDRLPIVSLIAEPKESVIKSALLRELTRGGQAYVIHNRVETIYETASTLKKMIPEAKIKVVHGQMDSDEIDQAFHAFKNGTANILVATTIVESGIDIPNANTILIERADHFGLADLYQLKGRVGRWNRKAWAYFLVKNLKTLPEISKKRLSALIESSGQGGGMKIAMRDLEIRGAGNLLGTEQSGHVSAIGFHLYCKLLKRTIQALQGKVPKLLSDPKLEFSIDARLPENYVNDVSLRMELYQRLGDALSFEDVDLIGKEMKDRFGPLPSSAKWLLAYSRIRVFCALKGILSIKQDKYSLTITWSKGKATEQKKVIFSPIKSAEKWEEAVLALLKKKL